MKEENNNENNEKTQNIEFENDNVTREINLDELYDGAVNNTVVIDPITNNEILLPTKKHNHTLIGIVLAVIILLVLYYVHNKSDFGRKTKAVEPKTTTITTINSEEETGTLTCVYNLKGDSDNQTVTYVLNYEKNVVKESTFNYVVISNSDTLSAVIVDLQQQYEDLYLKNNNLSSSKFTFDKNEKGFTFNVETKYDATGIDNVVIEDGKTVLYVIPNSDDTYKTLKEKYESKGFNCLLSE